MSADMAEVRELTTAHWKDQEKAKNMLATLATAAASFQAQKAKQLEQEAKVKELAEAQALARQKEREKEQEARRSQKVTFERACVQSWPRQFVGMSNVNCDVEIPDSDT